MRTQLSTQECTHKSAHTRMHLKAHSIHCPVPCAAYSGDPLYTLCSISQTRNEVLLQKVHRVMFSFGHNGVTFPYHLASWKQ